MKLNWNFKKDEVILLISDPHIPYEHRDNISFLKAVKKKYKPKRGKWRVICLGDEVDKHAMSFHPSDSDLPSAGDELRLAIDKLQPYYELFPEVDLLHSNHGSMAMRKAKFHGIPMKYLKTEREVLEAPKGWNWHKDLTITMCNGQDLYIHHGLKKDGIKLAEKYGCCVAQGHYHMEFNIKYSSNPSQLIWSIQVGCSIDDKSLAYEYNKVDMHRPIIGHAVIINGLPKLLPMVLNKKKRWIGIVP